MMFTAVEVLKIAVRLEENGANFYRKAIEVQKDPELVRLLTELAEDEIKHRKWFEDFLKTVSAAGEDHWVQEVSGELLQSMVGDQSFSLKEVDPASLHTASEIIGTAIEFEKDTILFYDMLRSFMEGEEHSQAIAKIIEEEQMHVQILEARLQAL